MQCETVVKHAVKRTHYYKMTQILNYGYETYVPEKTLLECR